MPEQRVALAQMISTLYLIHSQKIDNCGLLARTKERLRIRIFLKKQPSAVYAGICYPRKGQGFDECMFVADTIFIVGMSPICFCRGEFWSLGSHEYISASRSLKMNGPVKPKTDGIVGIQ